MGTEELRAVLEEFMSELADILKTLSVPSAVTKEVTKSSGILSKRSMLEIVSHEGIVQEAYKDSKGIWTWGVGVTAASGHSVLRYKDNPQPLEKVMAIFQWLVETKYLPDVLKAFEGVSLTESQLAAAVSFHYNTGAIKKASWVKSFKQGNVGKAKLEFMNYRKPVEIIPRREKERDLFFNGKWSNKGTGTVFTRVRKPSYVPDWGSAKQIKIGDF